ncbi:hypothetical protein K2173_000531 [Erythroxylum novogranatense]|uniref:Uncharacterized protein n=1 Tax=Erythroxylum novogranatense TaxID=1862640 RepID=A0AAV8SXK9_9ROSI|nr:hypothetical protein K2173_000531 [Erythroxylum novogranatense]
MTSGLLERILDDFFVLYLVGFFHSYCRWFMYFSFSDAEWSSILHGTCFHLYLEQLGTPNVKPSSTRREKSYANQDEEESPEDSKHLPLDSENSEMPTEKHHQVHYVLKNLEMNVQAEKNTDQNKATMAGVL